MYFMQLLSSDVRFMKSQSYTNTYEKAERKLANGRSH
jgi:hypothetical protein